MWLSLVPRSHLRGEGLVTSSWFLTFHYKFIACFMHGWKPITNLCGEKVLCHHAKVGKTFQCCNHRLCFLQCDWQRELSLQKVIHIKSKGWPDGKEEHVTSSSCCSSLVLRPTPPRTWVWGYAVSLCCSDSRISHLLYSHPYGFPNSTRSTKQEVAPSLSFLFLLCAHLKIFYTNNRC